MYHSNSNSFFPSIARNQAQLSLRGGPPISHYARGPLRATTTYQVPAAEPRPHVSQTHGNAVLFYHAHEPYYEFTNFYPRIVEIMGKPWPSTEHFFQAQKFVGTPIEDKIRKCGSAREAFELARNPRYQAWLHPDWHKGVKDDVMLLAVKEKFSQHVDLQQRLLETGEREIIEHTANDSYWGDGGGWGRGQNKLGKILMQVRGELREGTQSDDKKTKLLQHRSGSIERRAESHGSSRPRSRSLGRSPRRSVEYRHEHLNRKDDQPTTRVEELGRGHLSRRDYSFQALTGKSAQGYSHSTPQASRPASPSRRNESTQMAGILNHTDCRTPWRH